MQYTEQPIRSALAEAEHDYHRADHRARRAQTRAEWIHEVNRRNDAARRIMACALRSFEEGRKQ